MGTLMIKYSGPSCTWKDAAEGCGFHSDQKWSKIYSGHTSTTLKSFTFVQIWAGGQNMQLVSFSEGHGFYEWEIYIHWYFYSPSFSSFKNHEWGMRQRLCHFIFIKYAKGTPHTQMATMKYTCSFETHKNLKPFKRHPRLGTTILW